MGLREARQFTRAQASLLWQAICRRVGRAIRAGIRYWADGVYGHVLHTVIANLSTLFLITVYEVRSFNDWASWFSAVLP